MASGTIKNSEVGELVEFTGTNCSGVYMKIGRFVIAHVTQTVTNVVYPIPQMSKTLAGGELQHGNATAFRDVSSGGAGLAELYNESSGGIRCIVKLTSGHILRGHLVYATDD